MNPGSRPTTPLLIGLWLAAILLLHPESTFASEGLTLRDALTRSSNANPELKAFQHLLRAQDGRVMEAGFRPNPELVFDLENALGKGQQRGLSGAETTLGLRQKFEPGAMRARSAAAKAAESALVAQLHELQFTVAIETSHRFAEVMLHQARLQIAAEAHALMRASVAAVRGRIRAGKAPDAELARALAALARSELAEEDTEHELLTAQHQLAALWGEQPDFTRLADSFDTRMKLGNFDSLALGLNANPNVQRFAAEGTVRESELQLAKQQQKPTWELSAGIRRFELSDDFAMVVGFNMPLRWRGKGEGQIATATANLEKVSADRDAVTVKLKAELFALYQELVHSLHVIEKLDLVLIPQLQDALRQTQYAYQRGRYGYLELLDAHLQLQQSQASRIEARADAIRHAIEIDRRIGEIPGSSAAVTQVLRN